MELKGKRFVQASKNGTRRGVAMNGKVEVSTDHLLRLKFHLNLYQADQLVLAR